MKELLKNLLPDYIINKMSLINKKYFDGYALKSYSQEGEDLILKRIFENQKSGFYVDVGAHHPKRFSNTYYFYKKGWRGINIDAMPGSMKSFNKIRPRDINIETPIAGEKKILTYYIFNEPALNGFSKELSKSRDGLRNYKLISSKEIETDTLENILDEFLPKNQQIDFLSVDVEGLDFDVIKSLNLKKYQPKVIVVEILNRTINDILDDPIFKYLLVYDYELYAKSFNSVIFKIKGFV